MIGTLLAKRNVPKGLEALNRRDLETFLRDWAEDATVVYPGDIACVSGTHNGKAAIRAFYQRDLEQFPNLRFTPKHVAVTNLFDMTGNNVVVIHWDADVTNRDGFRLENSGVSVMTIRQRKVIHLHQYIFDTGEKFRTAWGQGQQQE